METAKRILLGVVVAGLLTSWIIYLCSTPWMQDEGFYLYFARLVGVDHLLPYKDFAFMQPPFFILLMSPFVGHLPEPIWLGRGMACASIAALVFLSVRLLRVRKVEPLAIAAFCLLMFTQPFVWKYFPLVKPHALVTLLVVCATLLVERYPFLAGSCLALAAGIRLNIAILAPLFVYWVWAVPLNRKRWLQGFLLSLLPAALLTGLAVQETYFDLFTYHTLRSHLHGAAQWTQRAQTLRAIIGEPITMVFLIMGLFSLSEFFRSQKNIEARRFWIVGFWVTFPFFFISPFYDEYLSTGAVLVGLGCALSLKGRFQSLWLQGAMLSVVFLALHFQTQGNPTLEGVNSLPSVAQVAQKIQSYVKPDEEFFTFWNGYAAASGRKLPRTASHPLAILEMEGKISDAEAKQHQIATPSEVLQWVGEKRFPLIVVGLGTPKGFEASVAKRYSLKEEVGGARFYVK